MEKISSKEIYKKHKKACKNQNKGEALRRSMREIQDLYAEYPICTELYYRYNEIKRNYFLIYTILPQVFLGTLTGIATGLIVGEIKDYISYGFWGYVVLFVLILVILVFVVFYPWFSSRIIFKSHTQILMEFEIKLIEKKIDSDFKQHKRIKCKIRSKK